MEKGSCEPIPVPSGKPMERARRAGTRPTDGFPVSIWAWPSVTPVLVPRGDLWRDRVKEGEGNPNTLHPAGDRET